MSQKESSEQSKSEPSIGELSIMICRLMGQLDAQGWNSKTFKDEAEELYDRIPRKYKR